MVIIAAVINEPNTARTASATTSVGTDSIRSTTVLVTPVDPAARYPGGQADGETDDQQHRDALDHAKQGYLTAVQRRPAEHITAQFVGAEQVGRARARLNAKGLAPAADTAR